MHYVISDVHNNCVRLRKLLKMINFSEQDHLFILGDLFDGSAHEPDPLGVYFTILELEGQCTVVRGNHDEWLAANMQQYYTAPKWKQKKMDTNKYITFELLKKSLTPVDMNVLEKTIRSWPLQVVLELQGVSYLLAHAKTSHPNDPREDDYYMNGEMDDKKYMEVGIEGYISICGHHELQRSIWKNAKENVYVVDCGCGYKDGRLGCLCLETKEEFYV